jgi:hypothetical protein
MESVEDSRHGSALGFTRGEWTVEDAFYNLRRPAPAGVPVKLEA